MSAVRYLIASTVLVAVLAGSPFAVAQDEVGTITLVEGQPELLRDGKPLYREVDPGFRVENFDWVWTDEQGALEIRFDPATGIDASVTAGPVTSFSVDLSGLVTEQTASIDLSSGSVSVTTRALSGGSRFQVRTGAATMGVRGTSFTVTTEPGGGILVSTQEGIVEVNAAGGRALFASRGEAVEMDLHLALFRTVRYERNELERFRREWRERRAERLVRNAAEIVEADAVRYVAAREAFAEAYGELMRYREILDRWMDQDRRRVPPPDGVAADVAEVSDPLESARAAMVRLESIFARLVGIEPVAREQVPDAVLRPGVSIVDLYHQLAADRSIQRERSATVRHILKLYAARNAGETPFRFPASLPVAD